MDLAPSPISQFADLGSTMSVCLCSLVSFCIVHTAKAVYPNPDACTLHVEVGGKYLRVSQNFNNVGKSS